MMFLTRLEHSNPFIGATAYIFPIHFFLSRNVMHPPPTFSETLSCQHFKKCAGISPILNRYQRFYIQNEAMNHCFHSSIKDLTNMTVIIGKFNGFKTENFWSGIVDLCSKIDWLRGVGRSDEKNNIRFRSGLDHFNMECFFSSIPSNL